MQRTVCRLILLVVAASTVFFFPCPGDWASPRSARIVRPVPQPPATRKARLRTHRPYSRSRDWYLPFNAFNRAVRFLKRHWSQFENRRFITIIDYTEPSTSRRLFLINMESGKVMRFLVSHGKNSGLLYATRFSNRPDSYETPLGFFRTGPEYYGDHGLSLVLYGLQKGINDNSASRKIVMHGAYYVSWGAIALNRRLHGLARLGLSLGCPAIPMKAAETVIDRIKDGSLLYMYANAVNSG